jgi:hypothetical protein
MLKVSAWTADDPLYTSPPTTGSADQNPTSPVMKSGGSVIPSAQIESWSLDAEREI